MRWRQVLLLALLISASSLGIAQDTAALARVDREAIRANESFTYVLRAEGRISGSPDLSALARDFDILQSGRTSRIQIVNGQATQVSEWTVELMPRAAGAYELPPIEVGGVLSNAVPVRILPPETGSDDAADVFIEVELDRSEVYVQAQAIYTLRLFVGIPTGREALLAPPVEGGEAIIESLGSDSEYQTVRGDRAYRVRERRFAIFPQTTGALTIGPAEYQATVIPNRGFSRRQSLLSDSVTLTVLPAVAPPGAHPDAVWLPAQSLRIVESWSDVVEGFEQGVPRTRQLSVVAEGLLDTQLPELVLEEAEGLRQYPDQPELDREITPEGIVARRTERFAVIANQAGTIEFPAVELPWWNVAERRWEVARIEPTTIEVAPAADVESTPPAAAAAPPPESDPVPDAGLWPWLATMLALGWLSTVVAWVYSRRGASSPKLLRRAQSPVSTRALLRQLAAACRVNDGRRAQELLLLWSQRQFADDPPASLGLLADRVPGPLGDEIRGLESALYGRSGADWRGGRLAELLKTTQTVNRGESPEGEDPLMPLYR